MIQNILLVGIGGFIGSAARYGTGKFIQSVFDTQLPFATFTVNIIGSFIIGLVLALFEKNMIITPNLKLLIAVGFCGGFTTFSSFAFENLSALQNGQFLTAAIYTSLSLLFGLSAVYGGFMLGK